MIRNTATTSAVGVTQTTTAMIQTLSLCSPTLPIVQVRDRVPMLDEWPELELSVRGAGRVDGSGLEILPVAS